MEEKKTISVRLSTFFLLVAIIALGVMGFFLYKINDEKTKATEQVSELNNRVALLESTKNEPKETTNTNTEIKKNNTESYSYSDVKGIYKYSKELTADITAQYELCLLDNGTFSYHYSTVVDHAEWGNYIIVDDEIILNKLFTTESDAGIHATESGKIKLKINSDGTITDTNELLSVEDQYKNLFKEIHLKKSLNKDDIEVLNNTSINELIKFTISMFINES